MISFLTFLIVKLGYNPHFWTPLQHLLYIYMDVNQFATIAIIAYESEIILNYFKNLIKIISLKCLKYF